MIYLLFQPIIQLKNTLMGVGSVRKDTEMHFSRWIRNNFHIEELQLVNSPDTSKSFYLFIFNRIGAACSHQLSKGQKAKPVFCCITRTVNKKFFPQQLPDDPEKKQGVLK